MSDRVKRLLRQARWWCGQERGRQSRLAGFLSVSRQAISGWFAECDRDHPRKLPTGEQALALEEFLAGQKVREIDAVLPRS